MNTDKSDKNQNISAPTSNGVDFPESFLTYHFTIAFPNFVKTRPKHIESVLENFNIGGLLVHLFSPYKRMTLSGKVSLADKLSFNIISSIVGAMVRIAFIISGMLVTVFFIIFDLISIIFYLIFPIFSYVDFQKKTEQLITSKDLSSTSAFVKKISKTTICFQLCTFFDSEFKNLFNKLPDPKTLGVSIGQKSYEPFLTLTSTWPDFKNYLAQKSIKETDYKILVTYLNDFLNGSTITKPKPIGQMLIYGYTNMLEKFGTELTAQSHPPTYGRQEILNSIQKTLTRAQSNNVLLVGDPGVGKHSVLESLASAINRGQLSLLADKRLVALDIVALLASSKNAAEIKGNFESLLAEAKRAGNIILAIDQIDRITTSADGRMDLTEVVTTILTDNSLPILGLTTIDDFNTYIRPNANMTSLFERIDVTEPTHDELLTILVGKSLEIDKKEKINVSLAAILEIMDKSESLMADKRQPEKSILILEDTITEAKNKKQSQLSVEIVDELLSEKTKTPVGKITGGEAQKLTDLETILHKRIVGQNEAIEEIAKAMRRARAQLEKTTRPMGSFLFLGPTGVGKTETAKALAQSYFDSEDRMVRLDMTEFQVDDAMSRLIGNPQTKSQGQLATKIREQPFGILLIDEFEKASRDVQNLFLQILDEGNLTDAFGKRVSFRNIIVIATSNAAAEYIREEVARLASTSDSESRLDKNPQGVDLQKKLTDYVLEKGLFSPELLNRFDGVIVYKPLKGEEVTQVAYLMLQALAKNLKETKNIGLEISPELAQAVAKAGFVVAFGARPIRRLIQDKLEDQIAKLMLTGKVKNGDTINSQDLISFLT